MQKTLAAKMRTTARLGILMVVKEQKCMTGVGGKKLGIGQGSDYVGAIVAEVGARYV